MVRYLNVLINKNIIDKNGFVLLYTDPYNFGIKDLLTTIRKFINCYYCELLFNFFSSDIRRNLKNESALSKMDAIKYELSSIVTNTDEIDDENKDLLNELIKTYKNTKNIKYSFAYRFNNSRNAELYYIVFFTPNKRGLELIKETIWDIFGGEDSFKKQIEINKNQLKLFDPTELLVNAYSKAMMESILRLIKIRGIIEYEEIETFILENSLLKESQIIKPVIEPLIQSKKIERIIPEGIRKTNYKKCLYKYVR